MNVTYFDILANNNLSILNIFLRTLHVPTSVTYVGILLLHLINQSLINIFHFLVIGNQEAGNTSIWDDVMDTFSSFVSYQFDA